MAPINRVIMLERTLVEPHPGTISELSLSLTFSDMSWINAYPIQRLIFYELPISKSHFIDVIIPKLKNSLSLALKHFLALAGKLRIPQDSSRPEIRYANGDSVPLVFAESDLRDFDYLISDQPRNCRQFYPLVPQLPQSWKSSGLIKVPLLALQLTLFPEIGICIGISNQHAAADGNTMYAFTRAWTMLTRLGDEGISSLDDEYLPSYDRDMMTDTKELDDFVWKRVRNMLEKSSISVGQDPTLHDTDKLRATFFIGQEDVLRLKNYVSNQQSSIKQISTFTVVCAYVWTCMVKSGNAIIQTAEGDESKYFAFVVDCRGRTDPPIPATYFGNCLSYCWTSVKNRQLIEQEGIAIAAELIADAIHKRLYNKNGPFKDLGSFFSEFSKVKMEQVLSIDGSLRQNYYAMDFGWGKPRKFECVSIDMSGAFSLSSSRESGGLEIGLSMPKEKLDAFATFFTFFKEGLKVI